MAKLLEVKILNQWITKPVIFVDVYMQNCIYNNSVMSQMNIRPMHTAYS